MESEGTGSNQGGRPSLSPVRPMLIALLGLALAAAGVYLLRRDDESLQLAGSTLFVFGQLALAIAMYRAIQDRAAHFAAAGVPEVWTRPPLRGLTDLDLRQWDNTIREMRRPWPDETTLLNAARARATGVPLLIVLSVATLLVSLARFVLMLQNPAALLAVFAPVNLVLGFLVLAVGVRYALDGRRARAYLARFGH
ncbi:hypothetical protein AB0J74_01695 [Asanoa sp. NPDC049573]|uniref:hypothetical protein n=1 Tax=Asanoa sp. NPDC049573 TaxID=3155396 RepID=UPI0034228A82